MPGGSDLTFFEALLKKRHAEKPLSEPLTSSVKIENTQVEEQHESEETREVEEEEVEEAEPADTLEDEIMKGAIAGSIDSLNPKDVATVILAALSDDNKTEQDESVDKPTSPYHPVLVPVSPKDEIVSPFEELLQPVVVQQQPHKAVPQLRPIAVADTISTKHETRDPDVSQKSDSPVADQQPTTLMPHPPPPFVGHHFHHHFGHHHHHHHHHHHQHAVIQGHVDPFHTIGQHLHFHHHHHHHHHQHHHHHHHQHQHHHHFHSQAVLAAPPPPPPPPPPVVEPQQVHPVPTQSIATQSIPAQLTSNNKNVEHPAGNVFPAESKPKKDSNPLLKFEGGTTLTADELYARFRSSMNAIEALDSALDQVDNIQQQVVEAAAKEQVAVLRNSVDKLARKQQEFNGALGKQALKAAIQQQTVNSSLKMSQPRPSLQQSFSQSGLGRHHVPPHSQFGESPRKRASVTTNRVIAVRETIAEENPAQYYWKQSSKGSRRSKQDPTYKQIRCDKKKQKMKEIVTQRQVSPTPKRGNSFAASFASTQSASRATGTSVATMSVGDYTETFESLNYDDDELIPSPNLNF